MSHPPSSLARRSLPMSVGSAVCFWEGAIGKFPSFKVEGEKEYTACVGVGGKREGGQEMADLAWEAHHRITAMNLQDIVTLLSLLNTMTFAIA